MVMDATPSPQCVGREFVRQYYTLMNEAPKFLHRFYSHNSSFVHSGDDKYGEEQPPVIGQTEIHNKIQSLNFKNCHAKILFVDSQATIGKGVVVQVTGELSNDGKPLRRFMQTFVLAPQSTNKYYVHNDIFRYQDEVFSETDEEEEEEYQQQQQLKQQTPSSHSSAASTRHHHISAEPSSAKTHEEYFQHPPSNVIPQVQSSEDTSVVNNSNPSGPVDPPLTNGHHPAHLTPEVTTQVTLPVETESDEPTPVQAAPVQHNPEPELTISTSPGDEDALNQSAHSPGSSAMSWARLVDQSDRQAAQAAMQQAAVASTQPGRQTSAQPDMPANMQTSSMNNMNNLDEFPQDRQGLSRATMRNNRPDGSLTKGFEDMKMHNTNPAGLTQRMDDRRTEQVKYPDNHQVFVGNLPSQISEFELRSVFKEYGNILEIRISRSSVMNKTPFGFVVFDNEKSALDVLSRKYIELKPGHRVNIEKKNPRSYSGPRQGGRSNSNKGFHRGGGGGGRGGNRAGYSGGGARDDGQHRTDSGRYYSNKPNTPYQH